MNKVIRLCGLALLLVVLPSCGISKSDLSIVIQNVGMREIDNITLSGLGLESAEIGSLAAKKAISFDFIVKSEGAIKIGYIVDGIPVERDVGYFSQPFDYECDIDIDHPDLRIDCSEDGFLESMMF